LDRFSKKTSLNPRIAVVYFSGEERRGFDGELTETTVEQAPPESEWERGEADSSSYLLPLIALAIKTCAVKSYAKEKAD
jgi:hypothetical protein